MTSLTIVLFALLQAEIAPPKTAPRPALTLVATIPMPKVEGRIDHMALDAHANMLFVAARENGTIELIDVKDGKVFEPWTDEGEPQGAVYVDVLDQVVVTDGKRGSLRIVSAGLDNKRSGPIGDDADNIRFLPKSRLLLVGYGQGALAYVDIVDFKAVRTVELGGHPESFQANAAETRAWVNVPSKQAIAVVDLETKKVARSIELKAAKQNYPMALVENEKRVLVGCREPAKLLVFDTDTDALTAELELSGDVDDIFVDDARGLVYASCGEGFVDVFERTGPGVWKPKEKVPTSAGARTCLFVATEKKLFVAVPHRGDQEAEIRVFSTAR